MSAKKHSPETDDSLGEVPDFNKLCIAHLRFKNSDLVMPMSADAG